MTMKKLVFAAFLLDSTATQALAGRIVIDTGHSPFITAPQVTADAIIAAMR